MRKVAVVGSGIAGLGAAYALVRGGASVTLFEAGSWFGGHSHAVDITLEDKTFPVDTGFLVFNRRTYPNLLWLFEQLGVQAAPSDMSFSVKLQHAARHLEWAGTSLASVFAQRRNVLDPAFLGMLADLVRFNREATRLALSGDIPAQSLGDFLHARRYGAPFRDWYLLPMAACIWSCPTAQMLDFPLATFLRFCHNHGLLQLTDRPQWLTVAGSSREYVNAIVRQLDDARLKTPVYGVRRQPGARGVSVLSHSGMEYFDDVVLACHPDQSLALLADGDDDELSLLTSISYQPNRVVLHTDASLLPQRRQAWAAWNYQSSGGAEPRVCVHYLINKLQALPVETPVLVSLNPVTEPDRASVLREFEYHHPVFDATAMAAQGRLAALQGRRRTWFAGAWTGYGFHEDGLRSGLNAAVAILQTAAMHHAA